MILYTLRRISAYIIILSFLLLGSCFYDVEEEIYGDPCSDLPATYSGAVLDILQVNCLACHNNVSREGNVTLEGYDEVIPYVNNQSLLGSLEQTAGFSPMPQDRAQLIDCDIDKIRIWINEGALNN